MAPVPPDIDFLPSTLEHRPLKGVEKVMLKRHFEESGAEDLDTFAHWEHANTDALRLLESWVWGMRFWGRETLFQVALAGFRCCKSLWAEGDGSTHVNTVKMGADSGTTMQEVLERCLRWVKVPGEEVAYAVLQVRGEPPEHWIAREVPPEDREGVFAFTLIANDRMAATVLEHRDEAARQAGQALVCAARALEATGLGPEQAVAQARVFLIREMRAWMGRKW